MTPLELAAPLVAIAGTAIYLFLGRQHYGADADYWEVVRRSILPQMNRLARRRGLGYAAYTLDVDEYLGSVPESPDDFEHRLERGGSARMWLAAFKYAPDGRPEVGSWAWRSSLWDEHQLHLILFANPDGSTDLFGHVEYNAYNPKTALQHYLGVKYVPLGELDRVDVEIALVYPELVIEEALGQP